MSMLLGKVSFRVNGNLLRSNEGAKIDLGGMSRTSKSGTSAVHGYVEKIKPAMVECEISLAVGDDIENLRNITGATITFEADTGHRYLVRDAFLTEPPVITEGDGGAVPLKFEGQPAEKV